MLARIATITLFAIAIVSLAIASAQDTAAVPAASPATQSAQAAKPATTNTPPTPTSKSSTVAPPFSGFGIRAIGYYSSSAKGANVKGLQIFASEGLENAAKDTKDGPAVVVQQTLRDTDQNWADFVSHLWRFSPRDNRQALEEARVRAAALAETYRPILNAGFRVLVIADPEDIKWSYGAAVLVPGITVRSQIVLLKSEFMRLNADIVVAALRSKAGMTDIVALYHWGMPKGDVEKFGKLVESEGVVFISVDCSTKEELAAFHKKLAENYYADPPEAKVISEEGKAILASYQILLEKNEIIVLQRAWRLPNGRLSFSGPMPISTWLDRDQAATFIVQSTAEPWQGRQVLSQSMNRALQDQAAKRAPTKDTPKEKK